MEKNIKLLIYHMTQDDPKKCTARKLARLGHATLITRLRLIPYSPILLDPYAAKVLSREDLDIALQHGLLAIDCSCLTVGIRFIGIFISIEYLDLVLAHEFDTAVATVLIPSGCCYR